MQIILLIKYSHQPKNVYFVLIIIIIILHIKSTLIININDNINKIPYKIQTKFVRKTINDINEIIENHVMNGRIVI